MDNAVSQVEKWKAVLDPGILTSCWKGHDANLRKHIEILLLMTLISHLVKMLMTKKLNQRFLRFKIQASPRSELLCWEGFLWLGFQNMVPSWLPCLQLSSAVHSCGVPKQSQQMGRANLSWEVPFYWPQIEKTTEKAHPWKLCWQFQHSCGK